MNFPAKSLIYFIFVSCPIVLALRVIQSKEHDGKPIGSSGRITWEPLGDMIIGEAKFDNSGRGIAISDDGSIIAIGAPHNDANGHEINAGHVRLFRLTNETWAQVGNDIDGKNSSEWSGWSLDISADGMKVVIGGYGVMSYPGVVRVYENINENWVQVGADLHGRNIRDYFGCSVAMSSDGSIIAIGAEHDLDDDAMTGSVTVYGETSGLWEQLGDRLYGRSAFDFFGRSVSLSGDGLVLAIGAPAGFPRTGYAQIYKFEKITGGKHGNWVEFGHLNGHPPPNKDGFGSMLSLSRDGSHVGISGYLNTMVRIYKLSGNAGLVQVENDIIVRDSSAAISLSNDGAFVSIGDSNLDRFRRRVGRAQVFQRGEGAWEQVGGDLYLLDDDDEKTGYRVFQRSSVAMSGDGSIVAVGADSSALEGKTSSGHVRVFKMVQPPTQSPTLVPTPTSPTQVSKDLKIIVKLSSACAGMILVISGFVIHRRKKKLVVRRDVFN